MAADSTPHRLRIKLGEAEFEAEGSPEQVQQQYERFIEALKGLPAAALQPEPPKPSGDTEEESEALSEEELGRLFSLGKDKIVSLRLLPKGKKKDADALLLLLYGYQRLRNMDMVMSTELMRAAKKSGIHLDRLDRTLAQYKSFVLEGGRGKGRRYGLNNPGTIRAQEIVEETLR